MIVLLIGWGNGLTVSDFDDNNFKSKMKTCFENWSSLDKTQTKELYVPIIKGVLKATIGEDTTKIKDHDGVDQSISDIVYDLYKKVPYHNICHGIMVSYYTYEMLKTAKITSPAEVKPHENTVKALVFAGLFHDIGHNGYTNRWCSKLSGTKESAAKWFCLLEKDSSKQSCQVKTEASTIFSKSNLKSFHKLLKNNGDDLVTRANQVIGIWEKYFDVDGFYPGMQTTTVTNFYTIFCESAEVHHAMIVKSVMDGIPTLLSSLGGEAFIEQVVIAILATDMDLYVFGSSVPRFKPKTGFNYLFFHWVHMADILAVGEEDNGLRREILKRVSHEFFIEKGVNPTSPFKTSFDNVNAFLGSQGSFVSSFVTPGKKVLITDHNQSSAQLDKMVKFAEDVKYQDLVAESSKQVKDQSTQFAEFKADYDLIFTASSAFVLI